MQTRQPGKSEWTRFYSPIEFETALEMESTLFAIDLFEAGKLHQRLIRRSDLVDEDVLTLLGFNLVDEDKAGTPAQLRKALAWQRGNLAEKLAGQSSRQTCNLKKLCGYLHFNPSETMVVQLMLMLAQSSGYSDLMRMAGRSYSTQARYGLLARGLGMAVDDLRAALHADSRPSRMGLVDSCSLGFDELPTLSGQIRDALNFKDFDEQRFLRHLVRFAPKPKLTVNDYDYLPQLGPLLAYLGHVVAVARPGVNILLYGPPGTGKTELARTLAQHVGSQLYEVPNQDEHGGAASGRGRFGAYVLSQQVLASQDGIALLFDEAEDVFGMDGVALVTEQHGARVRAKSWLNEQLETNGAPTFWTCNHIGAFDPAHLRRFDFVIEMNTPPRSVRRRIVERYLGPCHVSPRCMDELAAIEELSPAVLERSARVVRVLAEANEGDSDLHARRQIQDTLRAMGLRRTLPSPVLPSHYDLDFVNTDFDLHDLAKGMRKHANARICLYGPPGTGKTAFAHHLGHCLDRPVLVSRGSDLLGSFVGETEQNIASAFERARREQAVLVIDEADSFLRGREGAEHSWEVTQVNELLTQMEAFEGIFVASTNLMDRFDGASLRRFDFKIHFDYLKPKQRSDMFARVCRIPDSGLDSTIRRALDGMDHLTPGDFANVLRQLKTLGRDITPEDVMTRLSIEMAVKPGARRQPIGFVH